MLTLNDVTLTYQDGDQRLTAVDHATLKVAAGEFSAVIGPSGSGKSSLLALAATLIRPDRGQIDVDGLDAATLKSKGAAQLRRDKLGIVFQAPNLLPSLTVREQLEVMARIGSPNLAKLDRKQLAAKIDALLKEVGMLDRADHLPATLSGGQRQRVNIARAIIHDPETLLVDEPTSALDEARSAEIIALLRTLTHEHQLSTVVVTHDVEYLPSFDSVYEMHDGQLRRQR